MTSKASRKGSLAAKNKDKPTLEFELQSGFSFSQIIGVDEVGRGCLAGPVVAGAVALSDELAAFGSDFRSKKLPEELRWLLEVADSKLLTAEVRGRLAPLIEAWAPAAAVGIATVEEIDRLNIYHASHLAMFRAAQKVSEILAARGLPAARLALVDGNVVPKALLHGFSRVQAIISGDRKSLSIAAASVIAKVHRDRWISEQDAIYPGYGFSSHKAYSTPEHLRALAALGPCAIHRRSFSPIKGPLEKLRVSTQEVMALLLQPVTPHEDQFD